MDMLVSVLQRLEAKLDATNSRPSASRPPRPDPDPPYGMSSEWQAPSWTSEGLATHSVGVSIPPWSPTMSSISSWPQSDPFCQNWHEYTKGMGFHTTGPHQYPSWEPPRSRAGDFIDHRSSWEQSASRGPSSMQGPSSSYEFDPILGRPLTSWDLPRPRIAPESCSNRSDWDYWAPPTYSESYGEGGGYSKDSNNYNDYYNNEPQAWSYNNYESDRYNPVLQTVQYEPLPPTPYYAVAEPPQQHYYRPPPLPPHDSYYVPAPQPNPPSYAPPQQPWDSPCYITTPNDAQYTAVVGRERERGGKEMVEEENKDAEVMENRIIGMKTEEEFVSGDEATLEAGEAPASGSSKNSLQASLLLPTDGEMYGGTFYPTRKESSISLHALRPPSTGLVEQIELEIDEGKMKLSNESNGPMLFPLPSSAKIRKGGVADFAYEKRARSNRHEAGGNTSRVPFTQPRRSWHNEDQRIVGFAENGNGSSCRKLSFGSRRLVIFCLYELAEVYKEFVSPP